MNFLKVGRLRRRTEKQNPEKGKEEKPEEPRIENSEGAHLSKPNDSTNTDEIEDDDDDDFITNEVKKRLKELRRNSFMALIPEEEEEEEEESNVEEEDEGEMNSKEWRDVEAEGRQWWGGFDAVYDEYCDRMLFFDRLCSEQLKNTGIRVVPSPSTPSPRSTPKKLASPLRCLSLKKLEEPEEDTEHLQQQQHAESNPYQDLETAYVAQLCLTWEALHCQYTHLSQLISCQPETSTCYNHSAQQFQQFHVLLQRFIENEPFENGSRAELFTRTRNTLPKLLQVPKIQGSDKKEMEKETDFFVLSHDLFKIIESSILTFYIFLKLDKKKPNGVLNLFGNYNHMANPLQQVQSSLVKKRMKLKELRKKTKGWKKKSWPQTQEGVQLLFALIDVEIMSKVLSMVRISKEQLLWCEEKMKKLDFSCGKFQRHTSPILFPC